MHEFVCRFCNGCKLECSPQLFNCSTCYIAVDWEPTALHLRYHASQEKVRTQTSLQLAALSFQQLFPDVVFWPGGPFSKNLMMNLWKTYEKSTYEKLKMIMWFSKQSYKKLRKKLCKTYDKLTMTLQVSYKNVKFAASDVIQETLWRRLSLVEYFELKITDDQSDDFWRMLSKNDLPFS